MLPYYVSSIDLIKYRIVKHKKSSRYYAVLSQDWELKAQQMSSMDKGKEIICYRLLLDTPANSLRLTDETIKIDSSELNGLPVDESH
jgi:hypothetical protein